jgi:N-acetylmuramoyl-L-alanine amidase
MWARRGLSLAALVAALFLLPLPRACDHRQEEVVPWRYSELTLFSGERTRQEVEAALALVDPEKRLAPYFSLTDSAFEVHTEAGKGKPSARIDLRATAAPPPAWPRRRIAVDPGHFGGSWALWEKRQVSRDGGPSVREGELAWATARLIERDLREAGTEVRLLREAPPRGSYPRGADLGFDPAREAAQRLSELHPWPGRWITPLRTLQLLRTRGELREDPFADFALYQRYDLRRRAAAAEAFAADVTVSIHYDYTESDANGILVFVPGNFLGDELATPSQRFWAFRRALDGTLAETHRLASALGARLMHHFDLPALSASHDAETGRFWRAVDPARGVYARNLAILRRTPGIVLLLEGPCVNQTEEYRRLLGTEVEVDGRRYPERVRQYARAVVEALLP